MSKHVLITGGAGFLGSHVADELLSAGYRVRVFDNLEYLARGRERLAIRLDPLVELVVGDVRDGVALRRALEGISAVVHLAGDAPLAGSGHETELGHAGTSVLLQALTERPVESIVLRSSLAVYGEGVYRTPSGRLISVRERSAAQLQAGRWEVESESGEALAPWPIREEATPPDGSLRARFFRAREQVCFAFGRERGIDTTALRLASVYGPRSSSAHRRPGALTNVAARLLEGLPPQLYEDGRQRRDFVCVYDAARAFRLALEKPEASGRAINVGSGRSLSLRELARRLALVLGRQHLTPVFTQQHRPFDVRHRFPDVTLARNLLGYEPRVSLEEGLIALVAWLEDHPVEERVKPAPTEASAESLRA